MNYLCAFATVVATALGPPTSTVAAAVTTESMPIDDRFAWLWGGFSDSDAAQRSQWSALKLLAEQRATIRTAEVRAQLRALGVEPRGLDLGCYGDADCDRVRKAADVVDKLGTRAAFEAALREAQPLAVTYRFAVKTILQRLPRLDTDKLSLGEKLHLWAVVDQAWRGGMQFGAPDLPLTPNGQQVFNLLLWQDVAAWDGVTTLKLKTLVDAGSWPRLRVDGEVAARDAWLLVQHADNDPAFQLRVLRLMEPMVAAGEASAKHYGYLYDRVMLRIAGTQRYGTQVECKAGRHVPMPLEYPAQVDAYRKAVGMPPISEYLATWPSGC